VRPLFLYALLLSQTPSARPTVADAAITAEDVVAGFRQNLLSFATLRVTSRRVHAPTENVKEALQRFGEKLTAEELEIRTRTRAYHQQFWTDRIGFQLRCPETEQGGHAPSETFSFPEIPLNEETLPSEYSSILVFTTDGNAPSGLRMWSGIRAGAPRGAIHIAMPAGNENCHLPPLAVETPAEGFVLHPIDDFFIPGPEGLSVVGVEKYHGADTYVLERNIPDHPMTRNWRHEGDQFTLYWRHRAWVDPQRGYLPLRIERSLCFVNEGREYEDPWRQGPSYTIDVSEIREVDGGYYPCRTLEREFGMSASAPIRLCRPAEIIAGEKPPPFPSVVHRETTWEVSDVQAVVDMTGLFDVGFPEGTLYFDQRISQPMRIVKGGAEPVMSGTLARGAPPGRPPRGWGSVWLLGANIGAAAAIVGLLLYRRHLARARSRT
jgi:hypothetical protein